jgi:DNA repair protein RadD
MPSLWSQFGQAEKEGLISGTDPLLLPRIQRVLASVDRNSHGNDQQVYLPANLVRLLDAFIPSTALASKDFRHKVLNRLPPETMRSLAARLGFHSASLSFAEMTDRLASQRWEGRFAAQFVEFFGLPEHFLPQPVADTPATYHLRADGGGYPDGWERTPFRRLKGYQFGVYEQAMERLRVPRARFVIQMPTGSGKTRTAMELIADELMSRPGSVVVWLAHAEELCEQAIECFLHVWSHLGNSDLDVHRCWGQHPVPVLVANRAALVVAGFQKLHAAKSSRGPEALRGLCHRTTLVVVDEAHKTLAPTFQAVVTDLTSAITRIVGLTATPGRSTVEETEKLTQFYFGEKVDIPAQGDEGVVAMLRRLKVLARAEHRLIMTGIDVSLTPAERREIAERFDLPESVLRRLGSSDVRNIEIIRRLVEECNAGRQVLFFACSVEHSRFVASIMLYLGFKVGHIDGNTNASRRRALIQGFKRRDVRVLCNYGVLTTGFDAPNTDVVFISRPTLSPVLYGQMIGRGLRGPAVGGTEKCSIIDVRDNLVGFGDDEQVYSKFDEFW